MPGAVASRYAEALADAVLAPESKTDGRQAAQELRTFESMVQTSSELRNVLLSPAVPNSRKRSVVDRFAKAIPLSRVIRNFLFVVVDRRRIRLLSEIIDALESALDRRLGFVRAKVSSAAPLAERQKSEIQQALSRVSGRNVRCEFGVDPALIGGVVARIGSTVYDGSVRTQIESLRQRLVS